MIIVITMWLRAANYALYWVQIVSASSGFIGNITMWIYRTDNNNNIPIFTTFSTYVSDPKSDATSIIMSLTIFVIFTTASDTMAIHQWISKLVLKFFYSGSTGLISTRNLMLCNAENVFASCVQFRVMLSENKYYF